MPSDLPGVRRNYLASLRMARILEGIVPRMFYPTADGLLERREHSIGRVPWAEAHLALVHRQRADGVSHSSVGAASRFLWRIRLQTQPFAPRQGSERLARWPPKQPLDQCAQRRCSGGRLVVYGGGDRRVRGADRVRIRLRPPVGRRRMSCGSRVHRNRAHLASGRDLSHDRVAETRSVLSRESL